MLIVGVILACCVVALILVDVGLIAGLTATLVLVGTAALIGRRA
jgi:hypothetical protein